MKNYNRNINSNNPKKKLNNKNDKINEMKKILNNKNYNLIKNLNNKNIIININDNPKIDNNSNKKNNSINKRIKSANCNKRINQFEIKKPLENKNNINLKNNLNTNNNYKDNKVKNKILSTNNIVKINKNNNIIKNVNKNNEDIKNNINNKNINNNIKKNFIQKVDNKKNNNKINNNQNLENKKNINKINLNKNFTNKNIQKNNIQKNYNIFKNKKNNTVNNNLNNKKNNKNNNINKEKKDNVLLNEDKKIKEVIPNLIQFNESHANGLKNIGATCYMNATIQCLANVEVLTKYLLNPENTKNILSNKSKYQLTEAYTEVLENIWKNKKITYYSPEHFKDVISEMNPLFAGIQANDSKDLVLFLMENIHKELNKPEKIENSNLVENQYDYQITFNIFSNYFNHNYKSIISDNFYGMYNSMMTCLNCNITTNNVQCFSILIFPLEEVRKYKNKSENIVSIEECFEYYEAKFYMNGENQIYCNHCNSMSDSCNETKLIKGPKILVINLNRGKGLQFNIKLQFEKYLDLKKFIFNNDSPYYYELIGIVTHFGSSDMSGHFFAYCKSFVDSNWYIYDDSLVNISSFEEASSSGVPYILFYSCVEK